MAASFPAFAQDKKKTDKKKPEPRIVVTIPLGVPAGKTTRLTIRGSGLDKATDVELEHGTAKIVSKGAAAVPDKNPDKVGDSQVVVDVTVEAKQLDGTVAVTIVTPEGTTRPHKLLVGAALPEKEPNEGFKQSQEIQLPAVIEGTIERPKDVDVFRFIGKKGQKLSAEVLAHRYGSPLDAMLTLYNATGQQLAFNDDLGPETRDARIDVVLPADGEYYLALIDAHDAGSAVHAYRLIMK
jgi:hypothetical protein